MDLNGKINTPKPGIRVARFLTVGTLAIAVLAGGAFLFTEIQQRNAKAAVAQSFGNPGSITGTIGQNIVNISLQDANIGTVSADFYPEGCVAPISGQIVNTQGSLSWSPSSPTVIPSCALSGSRIGTLKSNAVADGLVTTNFSLPANIAQINNITLDNSSFIVNFSSGNLSSGNSLHFYYTENDTNYQLQDPNNLPQAQQYTGASPFTITTVNRPQFSQKLCVQVANTSNQVIPNSGNCASLPVANNITDSNISSGTCSPDVLPAGQLVHCTFPLSGSGSYTGLVVAKLSSTSSDATKNCTILTNNTLDCTDIPSTGAQTGANQILLTINGGTPLNKATVNIAVVYTASNTLKTGKLYFVGKDNAAAVLDVNSEFNTAYLQSQKFKEGPVKLVFDQIKDQSGNTLNTGACTFKLYRYGNVASQQNVLKSYSGTITNGKCEATFPVIDQTVNYYRVRAEVTSGDTTLYNIETLVLTVGATAPAADPGIEL